MLLLFKSESEQWGKSPSQPAHYLTGNSGLNPNLHSTGDGWIYLLKTICPGLNFY
jgi:hypothetical protein